ncbi:hypothetical protein Pen02_81210 [Plantactinospora endophytica]|uniref:DUF397 domain-containing protein n=1 Tax=Plantactinospora endophytica TaxID=673535 RepID=A0ABQ4EEV4_9ACTN|nr:hypothetical protein Pen02_81210 [Plantactinospora endophytica]
MARRDVLATHDSADQPNRKDQDRNDETAPLTASQVCCPISCNGGKNTRVHVLQNSTMRLAKHRCSVSGTLAEVHPLIGYARPADRPTPSGVYCSNRKPKRPPIVVLVRKSLRQHELVGIEPPPAAAAGAQPVQCSF